MKRKYRFFNMTNPTPKLVIDFWIFLMKFILYKMQDGSIDFKMTEWFNYTVNMSYLNFSYINDVTNLNSIYL